MESDTTSPVARPNKRRLSADEELEINLGLPEPPSKKARRKEKKTKVSSANSAATKDVHATVPDLPLPPKTIQDAQSAVDDAEPAAKRSNYGIWIGNLPFTATKDSLKDFFKEQGGIEATDIVRLHLPTAPVTNSFTGKKTTQNKGFAYVDFTSQPAMQLAIALSEKLLSGRRVLIKDAKSFEGRPDKADKASGAVSNDRNNHKEPTKKIFVGNLGFDVTKEDLIEHFSQAGQLEDVFLATFEDSGKCKGFAWLRFAEIEAAEAAAKGFIYRDPPDEPEDDDDDDNNDEKDGVSDTQVTNGARKTGSSKKRKRQKWFINRLNGRQLRCEFAEDAQTRYKKRFGKDSKPAQDVEHSGIVEVGNGDAEPKAGLPRHIEPKSLPAKSRHVQLDKEQRREDRRKRHEKLDARAIAPGKALANAPRASGAIVAGQGRKMVFDD